MSDLKSLDVNTVFDKPDILQVKLLPHSKEKHSKGNEHLNLKSNFGSLKIKNNAVKASHYIRDQ